MWDADPGLTTQRFLFNVGNSGSPFATLSLDVDVGSVTDMVIDSVSSGGYYQVNTEVALFGAAVVA